MPTEKSPNFIRIRVAIVKNVKRFRFKTISEKKGIRALIAFAQEGGSKIVSYLFSRTKWTVAKAKVWVKAHGHKIAETYFVHDILFHNDKIVFVEESVPDDIKEEAEPPAPKYTKVDWLRDELNG